MVLTFKINKLLTLKLEEGKSNVYINDLKFTQCKHLKINISENNYKKYDNINSIDEIIDLDEEASVVYIPFEVAFWAHCSNLQAWYENEYDTRLMDSKLAFPLLEKLAQGGDKIAKRVFKEEIIKRVLDGYMPTIMYLFEELEYLDNFYKEDFKQIERYEPCNISNNLTLVLYKNHNVKISYVKKPKPNQKDILREVYEIYKKFNTSTYYKYL